MKKTFRKMLIILIAVMCAMSVHITVSAQTGIVDNDALGNMFGDLINQIVSGLNPDNTTTENPDNDPTAEDSGNSVVEQESVQNEVADDNTTTETAPATTETTTEYNPPVTTVPQITQNNNVVPQITTTESAGDSGMSFTYDSSLSGLLEADSAEVIIQKPSETFTLGGVIVDNGGNKNNDVFSWQKIALIGAAGFFVVLAAFVVALLIQRSNKKDDEYVGVSTDYIPDDRSSGPVEVEVMSAERIAELLGTAPRRHDNSNVNATANENSTYLYESLSSEDSASAIKTAALMGQLNSYSDPLIRKYTEEPVRFSPLSSVSPDGEFSAAEILKATEAMLDDITGNEKFASDISGIGFSSESYDELLNDTEVKICPECQSPVTSGDVFCHSCGAYVG